jgi:uncharacterized peroxidase-related enzyme
MSRFNVHTLDTAPAGSKAQLEETKRAWGAIPNLHAVLAEAPAALEGYNALWAIFDRSSFTPAERQIVYLAANFENACHYCMAGHSVLGRKVGLSAETIAALRAGAPLPDPRQEALRRFAALVVRNRGFVDAADIDAFFAAGFGRQQVLEVILGVAVKTISNYANHFADTPLDPFMKDQAWTPPARAATRD